LRDLKAESLIRAQEVAQKWAKVGTNGNGAALKRLRGRPLGSHF